MGKKLLPILLILCLSSPVIAQKTRDADSPFRFGLNFNPILTWNSTGKNFKPDGIKVGFEYGLNVHYYFFKNVGFETGFYMNHHGAKFTYGRTDVSATDTTIHNYRYNINNIYAKIPLALRFRTNLIGPVYLFGNFGVDFSFAVFSKLKFAGSHTYRSTTENTISDFAEESYKINSAPVRIGLFLGGGVEYPISGSFSLTANLNYNYGFLNILREDMSSKKNPFKPDPVGLSNEFNYTTPDKEDVRTQYLGLNVGVLF